MLVIIESAVAILKLIHRYSAESALKFTDADSISCQSPVRVRPSMIAAMCRSVSVEMSFQEGVIPRLHCRLSIAAAVSRRLCERRQAALKSQPTLTDADRKNSTTGQKRNLDSVRSVR